MAKAGRADAYRQLPLREEDELAVVATLLDPKDGLRYGFIPRTQPSGSAATVLHYDRLSRAKASFTCRYLKIPCVGYYDYSGIVAPKQLILPAPRKLASFSDGLVIMLKRIVVKSRREYRFPRPRNQLSR